MPERVLRGGWHDCYYECSLFSNIGNAALEYRILHGALMSAVGELPDEIGNRQAGRKGWMGYRFLGGLVKLKMEVGFLIWLSG